MATDDWFSRSKSSEAWDASVENRAAGRHLVRPTLGNSPGGRPWPRRQIEHEIAKLRERTQPA